jgi:S1-C subfamily serine protease
VDREDDLLLASAERFFGNASEARPAVRVIVGPIEFAPEEKLANAALSSLRRGRKPTAEQRADLERLIAILRPAVLSENARMQDLPEDHTYNADIREKWSAFRDGFEAYAYSIGRIDRVPRDGGASPQPVGTGFLVAPSVLVTNRHVLAELTGKTMQLHAGQGIIRFRQEHGSTEDETAAIVGVIAVHSSLDLALLRVDSQTARKPIPISDRAAAKRDLVVVVGYPCRDDQRNPVFTDRIFGGTYGVKRGAPGEVVGTAQDTVKHDCSTLGGNSGSPLLSMGANPEIVGVHRDGPVFMFRNEAVDAMGLRTFARPYLG